MIAALDNGRGGYDGHFCVRLHVGDIQEAAVTHGGFYLVKTLGDVVVQTAGVGNVGVYAFFKHQGALAA